MAAGGIPEKSDDVPHGISINGRGEGSKVSKSRASA
jgi:hypothetical protein